MKRKDKVVVLSEGKRYSDQKERYSMIPNWIFDEGEYLELDVYEKIAFMYMIRLVNKKDKKSGQQDIFFLSQEHLAKKCGFCHTKAQRIIKKLIEKGYITRLKIGSNLTGQASFYKMLYLQPEYEEGLEVKVSDLAGILSDEELVELNSKDGTAYYHPSKLIYSKRKFLPRIYDRLEEQVV